MVKRTKGSRVKTRHKLTKGLRTKWKPQFFLAEFKPGQKVAIRPNPLSQKGMPWPKFTGLTGYVQARQGRAYKVVLKVGGKRKYIIARPEHLKIIKHV